MFRSTAHCCTGAPQLEAWQVCLALLLLPSLQLQKECAIPPQIYMGHPPPVHQRHKTLRLRPAAVVPPTSAPVVPPACPSAAAAADWPLTRATRCWSCSMSASMTQSSKLRPAARALALLCRVGRCRCCSPARLPPSSAASPSAASTSWLKGEDSSSESSSSLSLSTCSGPATPSAVCMCWPRSPWPPRPSP